MLSNSIYDLQKISHLEFVEMLSYYALSTPFVLSTVSAKSNEFWYLGGELLGAKNKSGYYVAKNKYANFKESEEYAIDKRHRKY